MSGCEEDAKFEELVWNALVELQGETFYTAKGLAYSYQIRGYEMFVNRKDKSITRATVIIAAQNARCMKERGEEVKGPKKLGTFGASYLYPIFMRIGLIQHAECKDL